MIIPKDNHLLETARALRRNMTPQERKLWYLFLRTYPVKIYKQRIIHSYIVDFYCDKAKLVLELDGSQHYIGESVEKDRQRTAVLESHGLLVVRLSNKDINENFSAVCNYLDQLIQQRIK